MALIFPGA